MYGLFTYIWLIFMVNVGKYTIPEIGHVSNLSHKLFDFITLSDMYYMYIF